MSKRVYTKQMVLFDILYFKGKKYDDYFWKDSVKFIFHDKPHKNQKPYIICSNEIEASYSEIYCQLQDWGFTNIDYDTFDLEDLKNRFIGTNVIVSFTVVDNISMIRDVDCLNYYEIPVDLNLKVPEHLKISMADRYYSSPIAENKSISEVTRNESREILWYFCDEYRIPSDSQMNERIIEELVRNHYTDIVRATARKASIAINDGSIKLSCSLSFLHYFLDKALIEDAEEEARMNEYAALGEIMMRQANREFGTYIEPESYNPELVEKNKRLMAELQEMADEVERQRATQKC